MLAERDKLNTDIAEILDTQTDPWGIKVSTVEIKEVDINQTMVRAIAKRPRPSVKDAPSIINAEGEQQAAQKLLEAAEVLARRPEAMQLRYLGTLGVIAGEKKLYHRFPFPGRGWKVPCWRMR